MSQSRDYRRFLYRLDLARKYDTIPSLIQHMMDETVIDGVLELRMITNPDTNAAWSPFPNTFISFRRVGQNVNSVAVYGPRSSPTPSTSTSSSSNRPAATQFTSFAHQSVLEVKKRYTDAISPVWVFTPLVNGLLEMGATSILFECRSYLATSDVAREVRAVDAAAAVAASARREEQYLQPPQYLGPMQYLQPQPTAAYPIQNMVYDLNTNQWRQLHRQELYATQQAEYSGAPPVASAFTGSAFPTQNHPPYTDSFTGQVSNVSGQQFNSQPQSTGHVPTQIPPSSGFPQPRSRPPSGSPSRGQKVPSPPHTEKEEDPAMELLNRRAPYKRMVGYAGKQHDRSVAVYELSDQVAATAFDPVFGMGMASIAALGLGIGSRGGSSSR